MNYAIECCMEKVSGQSGEWQDILAIYPENVRCPTVIIKSVYHNSYLIVIGVHEMHGQMHPNYCQMTTLLIVDLCSSLTYFMMTHPLPIASKLPIKTLVARQLPDI